MAASIPQYKQDLITDCLKHGILSFGTYTLKSGRSSPYFFNAGLFNTSAVLQSVSVAYAKTILDEFPQASSSDAGYDTIFGPAYKGIPLAVITCLQLGAVSPAHLATSYSFNRKEAKTHGEAGSIVGAPLKGKRVLVLDDVMTAGTALREAVSIIRAEGGILAGVVILLDRQEKVASEAEKRGEEDDGSDRPSTVEQAREDLGVPVIAVLTFNDIIKGLHGQDGVQESEIKRMEEYRAKYGSKHS